jgi:hypothetical protein
MRYLSICILLNRGKKMTRIERTLMKNGWNSQWKLTEENVSKIMKTSNILDVAFLLETSTYNFL